MLILDFDQIVQMNKHLLLMIVSRIFHQSISLYHEFLILFVWFLLRNDNIPKISIFGYEILHPKGSILPFGKLKIMNGC
jgi:hypothetical protein